MDPSDLARVWGAACTDAGVHAGRDVRLYPTGHAPVDHRLALCLDPGSYAAFDKYFGLTPDQIRDANAPAHRQQHRILLCDVPEEEATLGLLRHELEHLRQHNLSAATWRLMGLVEEGLGEAVARVNPPTLIGSAALYNLQPHERDANRAARALLIATYSEGVVGLLSCEYGSLVRDSGLAELATLPRRLVAFAALLGEAFENVLQSQAVTPEDVIQGMSSSAVADYRRIRSNTNLAAAVRDALAKAPRPEDVQKAGAQPAAAWSPVVAALDEAHERALLL